MLKNITLKNQFLIAIFFILVIFVSDLGNLNAIRQGTEGFYLQISKEMFETRNYLTPTYLGGNHWSKPPLHFWLAQPFYNITNNTHIFAARLSILIFSIICLILTSNWIKRNLKISNTLSLIFLCSSLGIIKYSRIFMMEAPLALLSLLSSLYFFDFLTSKSKKKLLLASLLMGLSILIKGPVSFVMITGGLFIYLTYLHISHNERYYKSFFTFGALGFFLGSLWFLKSYQTYGQEFFEYFFIRENLGKFTAKAYPIRHVLQGLLIYALPWSLYLLALCSKHNRIIIKTFLNPKSTKAKVNIYLLINCVFYFCLWLIPNQRSHHYAIPALPFFLILTLSFLPIMEKDSKASLKLPNCMIGILFGILSIVLITPLFFDEFRLNLYSLFILLLGSSFFLISSIYYFRNSVIKILAPLSLISLSFAWIYISPVFILPMLPQNIINFLSNKEAAAFVHKPYFIEEALNKKIPIITPHKIREFLNANPDSYFIVYDYVYKQQRLKEISIILKRWPIWQRGKKLKEIADAISKGDISLLKAELYLVKKKQK